MGADDCIKERVSGMEGAVLQGQLQGPSYHQSPAGEQLGIDIILNQVFNAASIIEQTTLKSSKASEVISHKPLMIV